MGTLAVYNSKGGVGKTTIALNLAGQAAQAGFSVLLWEIDCQGDCSWLLDADQIERKTDFLKVMNRPEAIDEFIQQTRLPNLSLLPADDDARNIDNLLNQLVRQQKFLRMLTRLGERFDLILFDCPPGRSDAVLRLLQNVDLIVTPSLPSPLAMRGLMRVRDLVMRSRGTHAPILPVFSMFDVRRKLHRESRQQFPDWPVIPYMSDIERMLLRKAPICVTSPRSPAAAVYGTLWRGIEMRLRKSNLIRVRAATNEDPTPCRTDRPEVLLTPRPGMFGSARRIFARGSESAH